MSKRLHEIYQPGERVEITFGRNAWRPAVVIRSDPPGLWVRDRAGQNWFVTNGRRIRPLQTDE